MTISVLLFQATADSHWPALAVSLVALAGVLAKVITDLVKQRRQPEGANGHAVIVEKLRILERGQGKLDEVHQKLIPVLDNPESSGFGTVGMEQVVRDNTQAIRELATATKMLTNMARWMYEEATGKKPPPV